MNRNVAPNSDVSVIAPEDKVLDGSFRASVVGNEKGNVFIIPESGARMEKWKQPPKRLQQYLDRPTKKLTAEDIKAKQMQADERKKIHDALKAQTARKVSEESSKFDKKMRGIEQHDENAKKWFSAATMVLRK